MRTAAVVLIASAVVSTLALATARAQRAGSFEVASIRRNVSNGQQGGGLAGPQPGGRFIAIGATLRRLVSDAYDSLEVEGGPSWIGADRFDVDARGNAQTPGDMRRMLRGLLAERFSLTVHTETREMAVYTLAMARTDRRPGPRLRSSSAVCADEARNYFPAALGFPPPCGDFRLGAGALTARGMTMATLARLLAGRAGRPGVDRNGLDSFYDLDVEWSSDLGLTQAPRDSAGVENLTADGLSLFTALQEQLGLRLEPGRGPVDVVVIDRAEPPTPD